MSWTLRARLWSTSPQLREASCRHAVPRPLPLEDLHLDLGAILGVSSAARAAVAGGGQPSGLQMDHELPCRDASTSISPGRHQTLLSVLHSALGLQAPARQAVAPLTNWAARRVQRRRSGSCKELLMSRGSAGGRRGRRRSGAGLRRFPTPAPCEPSKGGRREHGKGLLAGISCSLCDLAALPAVVGPGPRYTR